MRLDSQDISYLKGYYVDFVSDLFLREYFVISLFIIIILLLFILHQQSTTTHNSDTALMLFSPPKW